MFIVEDLQFEGPTIDRALTVKQLSDGLRVQALTRIFRSIGGIKLLGYIPLLQNTQSAIG